MVKRKFICRNCGNRFETEVLEEGEAEEKKVRPVPVQCPKCNSTKIEKA